MPNDEAEPVQDSNAEEGAAFELFLIVSRMLPQPFLIAIDACCEEAHPTQPLIILQAFQHCGLNAITSAFEQLEKSIIQAREEYKSKIPLDTGLIEA